MGWIVAMGQCAACGEVFAFNPDRVPSVRVRGVRRPICRLCVEVVNPQRTARGLEPIPILPDAYEGQDA